MSFAGLAIGKLVGSIVAATMLVPVMAQAAPSAGAIETPEDRSFGETGIGIFSGWHCRGEVIQVRIDGGPPMTAGARTPRGDTQEICGRADTGWSLLYNFNLLDSARAHEAVAYADGVEFARSRFRTVSLGVEYLTERSASCEVLNFPNLGDTTSIAWSEAKQNFSISTSTADPGPINGPPAPPISGRYYGGVTTWGPPTDEPASLASFIVELSDSLCTLIIEYADGHTCEFSAPWHLTKGGVIASRTEGSVNTCGPISSVFVSGETLSGGNKDLGGLRFEGIRIGP
jgi:hypothetical protein